MHYVLEHNGNYFYTFKDPNAQKSTLSFKHYTRSLSRKPLIFRINLPEGSMSKKEFTKTLEVKYRLTGFNIHPFLLEEELSEWLLQKYLKKEEL